MKQIVVIGGGASGMAAAIAAARKGAAVTILEHTPFLGKKLAATGNGRCNFTNLYLTADCYRGENPSFAEQILNRFSTQDAIDFFAGLGVLSEEKGGYVYPYSNQASTVVDALTLALHALSVQVYYRREVTQIQRKNGKLLLTGTERVPVSGGTAGNVKKKGKSASQGQKQGMQEEMLQKFSMTCDAVILACGSKAAPKTGSDGSGYGLCASLGHRIVPVRPALVQLRCQGSFLKEWTGVRCQGKISLYAGKELLAEDTGELQLTDYGISGIPVFQVSRFGAEALSQGKKVTARLNFLPKLEKAQAEELLRQIQACPERNCPYRWLSGILPQKLVPVILGQAGIPGEKLYQKIDAKAAAAAIPALVQALTAFEVFVVETNSFDQAQVCAGGVDTREVTECCASKCMPGVYIVGELLDVDGICGGYNLHFAWATGIAAGEAASVSC